VFQDCQVRGVTSNTRQFIGSVAEYTFRWPPAANRWTLSAGALAALKPGRFDGAAGLVTSQLGDRECLIRWRWSDGHPRPEVAEHQDLRFHEDVDSAGEPGG
jgi:hypothetical protein